MTFDLMRVHTYVLRKSLIHIVARGRNDSRRRNGLEVFMWQSFIRRILSDDSKFTIVLTQSILMPHKPLKPGGHCLSCYPGYHAQVLIAFRIFGEYNAHELQSMKPGYLQPFKRYSFCGKPGLPDCLIFSFHLDSHLNLLRSFCLTF